MKSLPETQTAAPMLLGAPTAVDVPVAAPRPSALPAAALRLLSDERLAGLASSGDRPAFGVIFHRYHRELHRYCFSILRNAEDAGDALQSTMLRALNALEGDTREIALRPWLYRIAHNECITLVRRRHPADVDAELSVPAQFDSEASAELRAQLTELLGDLRELPERQRGALVMRELAGLDYAEIAAVLETTPAGAKQATYDARRALHDLAKGREMDCADVCTAVSDGDGRALRGRALCAHLRACSDCRDFRDAIVERQSRLAAIAPVMPSTAAAGLLEGVFASAGGGIGGAGLFTGFAVSGALKSVTALTVAAAVGTSAIHAVESRSGDGSAGAARATPVVQPSVPAAPARTAPSAPSTHGARRGATQRGSAHGTRVAGGSRGHSRHATGPNGPAGARHGSAGTHRGTASASPVPPPVRTRSSNGPVRQLITPTTDDHPVRNAVDSVRHTVAPTVPEVRQAVPVELPPVTGRHKMRAERGERSRDKAPERHGRSGRRR